MPDPEPSVSRRWTLLLLAYVAFFVGVLTLAYAEVLHTSSIGHGVDKIGHFGFVAILTYLAHRAAGRRWTRRLGLPLPAAPVAVLLIITAEEIAQHWAPSRTADINDWLADLAGVVSALAVDWWWQRSRTPQPIAEAVALEGDA